MQIVEGGYYKRRGWEVVGPAEKSEDWGPEYPWKVGRICYTDKGQAYIGQESGRDLITRVNHDGTPYEVSPTSNESKEKTMARKTCITAEEPIELEGGAVVFGAFYNSENLKLLVGIERGVTRAFLASDYAYSPEIQKLCGRLEKECKPLVKLPMTVEQMIAIAKRVSSGETGTYYISDTQMRDALAAEGFEVPDE